MNITHIFFGVQGTLASPEQIRRCYHTHLGEILNARYGGAVEAWKAARLRIEADWESYYADLDLGGDDGLEHLWEGQLRTTRALFRLVGVSEPDITHMIVLSRELPEVVMQSCNTLYPETKTIMAALYDAKLILGVTSQMVSSQVKSLLRGGGVLDYFGGPIVGPDVVESAGEGIDFYQSSVRIAGTVPEQCLMVDCSRQRLHQAKTAGLATMMIWRSEHPHKPQTIHPVIHDLWGIIDHLKN